MSNNFLVAFTVCCLTMGLSAAPYAQNTYANQPYSSSKDVGTLKYQLQSLENDLRKIKERLNNQDTTVEALRDRLDDFQTTQEAKNKGATADLEDKMALLQEGFKSLGTDLKALRDHLNDFSKTMAKAEKRNSDLEDLVQEQNKNISKLQAGLNALFDALEIKNPSKAIAQTTGKFYKVESGDSLDKIALKYNMSVKAIKELNNLKNDKIVIGQKLKIEQ